MNHFARRRVRVRDVGGGSATTDERPFEEFLDRDAVILLGDPGLGKTTLLQQFGGEDYFTIRQFMVDARLPIGSALYLDALDEHRFRVGTHAPDDLTRKLIELGRPRFCLACRAADWFGSLDQDVVRIASASRSLTVLELLPLSDADVAAIAAATLPDPDPFLADAGSFGLLSLLRNPMTLDLFIGAWSAGKRPKSKFEAYKYGIEHLITETNSANAALSPSTLDDRTIYAAATAANSTALLSNSPALVRRAPANRPDLLPSSVVPHDNTHAVEIALGRRVFASFADGNFTPIHRTIAEFLAGEDLASRVTSGLPISRALALMSGADGAPVTALRGTYAWMMCHLPALAHAYVHRDPYAVAVYGDASVLPPAAQIAIWGALAALDDPWFLSNQEDRGSFQGLANEQTISYLRSLFSDPDASPHLKVAVFEALKSAPRNDDLASDLEHFVLAPHDNTWLRTTAMHALVNQWQHDAGLISRLDDTLAQLLNDPVAPELRVALCEFFAHQSGFASHLLAVLTHVADPVYGKRATGHLWSLRELPSDIEAAELLDHAAEILRIKTPRKYELRGLFEDWLQRLLASPTPIDPSRTAAWLQQVRTDEHMSGEIVKALKPRVESDSDLFHKLFAALLAQHTTGCEADHWLFLALDVWKSLPPALWPAPQYRFFLDRAEQEANPEFAANYFRMFLNTLPADGGELSEMEAAWALVERRGDVQQLLGNWCEVEIPEWRFNQWDRKRRHAEQASESRRQRIVELTPEIPQIRDGTHSKLPWACAVYLSCFSDLKSPAPFDRLLEVVDEPLADAFVEGFRVFLDRGSVPSVDQIIGSWAANQIPFLHLLVSLSLYQRLASGIEIPSAHIDACIAAIATDLPRDDKLPGFDKMRNDWLIEQATSRPDMTIGSLSRLWGAAIDSERDWFPGLHALEEAAACSTVIAETARRVLRQSHPMNHANVEQLLLLLLRHDPASISDLATSRLAGIEATEPTYGTWLAALHLASAEGADIRNTLGSSPEAVLWAAINVWRSGKLNPVMDRICTSAKRFEIVSLLGRRFPNVGQPLGSTRGDQNPWDASQYVGHQIQAMTADPSPEAERRLNEVILDTSLQSYRDSMRHQLALRCRKLREAQFEWATPAAVAQVLRNQGPVTASDLRAYVADQLALLSDENRHGSFEPFQAFWNKKDRTLIAPKREEECSGILAHELQLRIQHHQLVATVEYHMVADKECDIVILQGTDRILPLEVKHHYHRDIWEAWRTQLDRLYTRDPKTSGMGIYCVLWSGETTHRRLPSLPQQIALRPDSAAALQEAMQSLMTPSERARLSVVVIDISHD